MAFARRQGRRVKLTEAGQQLAQLAQARQSGVADFQQNCQGVPQSISLNARNSLLQWAVRPQIAEWRRPLGKVVLELWAGRIQDIVRRLADLIVDLGLAREDAVTQPLDSKRVLVMTYALSLPRRLAGSDDVGEGGWIVRACGEHGQDGFPNQFPATSA